MVKHVAELNTPLRPVAFSAGPLTAAARFPFLGREGTGKGVLFIVQLEARAYLLLALG